VAVDLKGHVACATSTGGITGQRKGRVGDTPIPGAGGWADDATAAVSTTGHGEAIMRVSLSRHIVSLLKELPLQEATSAGLEYMRTRVEGFGGAIAVNSKGEVGVYFTTEQMPWASMASASELKYGVRPLEQVTVELQVQ
jgi:beta-aspartyl-peptidase (threonine type)